MEYGTLLVAVQDEFQRSKPVLGLYSERVHIEVILDLDGADTDPRHTKVRGGVFAQPRNPDIADHQRPQNLGLLYEVLHVRVRRFHLLIVHSYQLAVPRYKAAFELNLPIVGRLESHPVELLDHIVGMLHVLSKTGELELVARVDSGGFDVQQVLCCVVR